jgi:D-alanine-D-alanine ligase
MRDPLRVVVLMGGANAEREVSLKTGATVVRELCRRHRIRPVEILATGAWRCAEGIVHEGLDPSPDAWFEGEGQHPVRALDALLGAGVDVVFNALHGPLCEDGTIQGFFRTVRVPLTRPDVIPAAVTMDKRLTKLGLAAAGVGTPRFFWIPAAKLRSEPVRWDELLEQESRRVPLPWVLKPNRLGSSVGVAILRTPSDVLERAQEAIDAWPAEAAGDDLLVEEAIQGRELTCGVLETDGAPRALPPIEIRPRTSDFFDYHAKYTPGASEEVCPAPLTPSEDERVRATAVEVHRLFGCAPLSRTDMFLTGNGDCLVLEVNTLPGMTSTSLVPLAASRAGIPLADLFSALVEHALARAFVTAGVASPR